MRIIVTGQLKEDYFRKIESELVGDISRKTKFEIIELKDEKIPQNSNDKIDKKILDKEGENILSRINKSDFVISLCIEGKIIDSQYFQNELAKN